MLYSIAGTLNSLFILASLYGIWSQLQKIWQRRREGHDNPSDVLSLNQFMVSFLAYWAFFVYGYSIEPFNHFMVWPRAIAALLALGILAEIRRDRCTRSTDMALRLAVLLMFAGAAGLVFGKRFVDEGRLVSQGLIVLVTVLLAQGYAHQIRKIVLARQTGAVSLRMSQFILAMDLSSIFFACVMGLETGWPLLLLATVSAITKLLIMWLFRWEKRIQGTIA
ncbi:hypothetical protein [Massilia sp. erpn]|uniref:hypothetical protein n=1 Tax=Massilia sp. erpn TaxID=2738142 RepID=UPI002107E7B4|nr:hypothetical protein [Massilia sp. erpn]UTY59902.1 hypothetical protein HPQ68_23575 [Massilia sp. erpn]